jgi:hypothetical protein
MDLEPIEGHVRSHAVADDTVLLIRGGPLAVEKLVEHAQRQMREFSFRGAPMASVSVDGTVPAGPSSPRGGCQTDGGLRRRRGQPVQEAREAMMAHDVVVDIPCAVQQVDGTGFVWTLLDEARDPRRITVEAIVVTGDEVDPVLARVVSLTKRPTGVKVHLQLLPGDPADYAEALTRAHLLLGTAGGNVVAGPTTRA